jgi:hypothetical protein
MQLIIAILLIVCSFSQLEAQTRFYFPSTGAPAISPAFNAGWDTTSNADRIEMVTTRINSADTNKAGTGNAAVNDDHLLRQYVSSEALDAQTITGTIKGQVRGLASTAGTGTLEVSVSKCASDGSGVTEILAITFSSRVSSPPFFGTTIANRRFEVTANVFSLTLTSTAVNAGDFLIVEIGYRDTTSNTSRFATLNFGDDSATDLPEDETTTTADNPWIEFSNTITFQTGGAPASAAKLPILGVGDSK